MGKFKSFIGWKGVNFDGSGSLVAAFERMYPKEYEPGERRSPVRNELKREVRFDKENLDGVLSNPKASWSKSDRALIGASSKNLSGGQK